MPVCVKSSALATNELRSESPLSARVKRRLEQSGYYSVRKINIHEHEGVLTLYGSVSSFYLKQVAQAAAAGVPGVEQIHNRVQVVEPIR